MFAARLGHLFRPCRCHLFYADVVRPTIRTSQSSCGRKQAPTQPSEKPAESAYEAGAGCGAEASASRGRTR